MCKEDAKYRYTWPGRDESLVCEKHVEKLKIVAKAMGFHLQVIPLDENDKETKCRQKSRG